jgi:predicted GNAT family acetyltransferase
MTEANRSLVVTGKSPPAGRYPRRVSTTVQDVEASSRYEISVDGTRAGFADYRRGPSSIEITHTEVDDDHEGQGLAQQLTEHALREARSAGLAVLPTCPYVAKFIARNREYADLVPKDRRSDFGL